MNRRDFIKNLVLGSAAVSIFPLTSVAHDNRDLWDVMSEYGFEWKMRYPGCTYRGGLQPGPWFIKHPLIGKVDSAVWVIPGEHGVPKDDWKNSNTSFYSNTGQLHHWCFHEDKNPKWTLYMPYSRWKNTPISKIEFNTPQEFEAQWKIALPLLRGRL